LKQAAIPGLLMEWYLRPMIKSTQLRKSTQHGCCALSG
jgi:hypothetical protein